MGGRVAAWILMWSFPYEGRGRGRERVVVALGGVGSVDVNPK